MHFSSLALIIEPRYRDPTRVPQTPIKQLRLKAFYFDSEVTAYSSMIEQPIILNPIFALCATFTSVTILQIRRCTFRTHNDLRHFIQSFPRLRDVTMAHVHCDILRTGACQFGTQDTNNILAMPELVRFVAHVGSSLARATNYRNGSLLAGL